MQEQHLEHHRELKRYYIFALSTWGNYPYCGCDAAHCSEMFYCILDECDVNKAVETFVKRGKRFCCWYCLQDALLDFIPSYDPFKGGSLPEDVSFFYVRLPSNLCYDIEEIWKRVYEDEDEEE